MRLEPEKLAEIEALRAHQQPTRRATVPALEEILGLPLPVLDHGFVRVIDYMGDDAAIVQAARVSYGKGTKKPSSDRALIRYLMRHRHTSPFEMCEIKFHIKLPIFVARQWIRHRTANVNEYSARYSILDREFYLPDREFLQLFRIERKGPGPEQARLFDLPEPEVQATAAQSTTNKQGREGTLAAEVAAEVIRRMKRAAETDFTLYERLLGEGGEGVEGYGIARELARLVLPLSTYTQWYWKIDLHNLLHFLELRADPHAQAEIRAYAQVILDVVRRWVPLAYEAFEDYRRKAFTLSGPAREAVRRALRGEAVDPEALGLSRREWEELRAALPELATAERAPPRSQEP
ncbi:MAG: FAD-dependent thymidylate synthase [Geminicoccaceae bacterium]|nr:FAD-dependent thymidylate synthase [Geminicoccaceae bacterium]MCX7631323.1 FAD-dependent thymidylate synthase [Geminicoccaceae bacterium]MDW8123910.1 FAD-dependent thymidylate synthase [Geminicoccaceae bacterium]